MNIRDLNNSEKPREKIFEFGVKSLNNIELISAIIGKGSKDKNVFELSSEILKKFPLNSLKWVTPHSLMKIQGLGKCKVSQLISSIELSNRCKDLNEENTKVSCAKEAYKVLKNLFVVKDQEQFAAIYLNSRNQVIMKKIIFIGTIDKQLISPREIAKYALEVGAVSVIIAHNHPSGNLDPSEADILATEKIRNSLKLFDIQLLDHIVLTNQEYNQKYKSII